MAKSPYASVSKDRCRNCRVCTGFGRQVPSDQRTEPATVIGSGLRDDAAKVRTFPRDLLQTSSQYLLKSAGSVTKRIAAVCLATMQQYISARHSKALGGNNSRGPVYNLEVRIACNLQLPYNVMTCVIYSCKHTNELLGKQLART